MLLMPLTAGGSAAIFCTMPACSFCSWLALEALNIWTGCGAYLEYLKAVSRHAFDGNNAWNSLTYRLVTFSEGTNTSDALRQAHFLPACRLGKILGSQDR